MPTATAASSPPAPTWTAVRAFGSGRFRERVAALAPDVLFAGERELDELDGGGGLAPVVVVKRGAAGISVVQGGRSADHPAVQVDAMDTTGAGDALAAGFLVGGPALGIEAAARCVAKLGTMP